MTRLPLASLVLLSLAGCPRSQPPVSSGSAADESPARIVPSGATLRTLREDVRRRLDEAEDPGSRRRLQAAAELVDRLAAIEPAAGRAGEREGVQAYARFLEVVVQTERRAPGGVALPLSGPSLEKAIELHRAGQIDAALAEGYAVLDALAAGSVDSRSLRLRLGEWALEVGDPVLAVEQFEAVRGSAEAHRVELERAAAGLAEARELALGPEGAAVEEARELLADGELAAAASVLAHILETGRDPAAVRDAQRLAGDVSAASVRRAEDALLRAERLLEGAPPYDAVATLLDEVQELPDGTWDRDEHRRLTAWYRGLTRDDGGAQAQTDRASQEALLQEGRSLVAAGEYRKAVEHLRKLDGTPLQSDARREAAGAVDTLVQEERRRAGRLVVAARKRSDAVQRRAGLQEVRDILAGLLSEFPESSYADRVAENLRVVEAELGNP